MSRLDFIKKLYNGRNCYSDHMAPEELDLLHIKSNTESIVDDMLSHKRIIFLTGNPGDGKTFIIKELSSAIARTNAYCQSDLNNISDYDSVARELSICYATHRPAIVAVNEYPFLQLLRCIKLQSLEMYDEIQRVRHNVIAYGVSNTLSGQIAVVDLNERNLLASDYGHIEHLITRFVALLREDLPQSKDLLYNMAALEHPTIKERILSLFRLAASECKHFAVRDILGALSFCITACTTDEHTGLLYYSSLFEGSNDLLRIIQQYDPVRLSIPSIDEKLWNGDITIGWLLSSPEKYPKDYSDVNEAIECFKNVKRQYFFENVDGGELMKLQPSEILSIPDMFIHFEQSKNDIKKSVIHGMNKLFLPSSTEKRRLCIWTTHRFDISMEATVAISSKFVDGNKLDLLMPRPADWLKGLEYCPDHIIMKPKGLDRPKLVLDVDFLRTLHAIEKGYPIGLLAPQYEQATSIFLQSLNDCGLSEDNDDGEIILASRTQSFYKKVFIQDGKYSFGEED